MTEVSATNGDAPDIELDDFAFLAAARSRLAAAQTHRETIVAQIAEATENVKRWEKVVRDLDPESASSKPAAQKKATRGRPSGIGPERVERIIAAIRDLAGPDGENEFRQVDVRNALDNQITSSITTVAFRQLRDEEVIRLTRKEGINQFYRLTRKAASGA